MTRTTLVIPDTHISEHDRLALACANKIAEWLVPDEIVLTGDFIEAAAWSRHPGKTMAPAKRELFRSTELDPAAALLRHWKWNATDSLVYVEGNHEHRVQAWCAKEDVGPDVYDALSPKAWFEGFCKWIPFQAHAGLSHYAIADDLWCVHGWSTGKASNQRHLDVCGEISIIHGHDHVFSWTTKATPVHGAVRLTGDDPGFKIVHSMSPGCLRTLGPAWLGSKPQPWSHGIAIIFHGAHSWTPCMVPIFQGRAIIEGKKIEATQEDVERLDDIMGLSSPRDEEYTA